jgi:hypothetical protein
MKPTFNVAESGDGSYRLLAILRWVMVVVFVSFGMQKFTLQSAQGIVQFISNSPFISWLSLFGLRVFSRRCRICHRGAARGRCFQPDLVGRRFADGRGHFCDYVVILFHDAGGREMELVD